jgi:hypothetical protein
MDDTQVEFHAAMMTVPLDAGFCPERWKQAADLNQVLRIASARNTTRLANDHEGIISDHHYGRAHKTCMTPVLNKLLTIQILIQKKVEVIVFDNDAKGCYDRIISGIALACIKRIGYSSNYV